MNYCVKHLKGLSLSILAAVAIFISCQAAVEELVGPSILGNTLRIEIVDPSSAGISAGGSQATVRVEVFRGAIPAQGAVVTLTTTLGTLGAASLNTNAAGTRTTTLTSGAARGLACVTATVDNISAFDCISII